MLTCLLDALQAHVGDFINLRRDSHCRPELAFKEHRNAGDTVVVGMRVRRQVRMMVRRQGRCCARTRPWLGRTAPAETAFAREAALERVGAQQRTLQGAPLTASEDGQRSRHHPGLDFDDRNIGVSSAQSVQLAARFLAVYGQAAAR